MEYGGFWIRVVAYLIDYVVLLIAQIVVMIPLLIISPDNGDSFGTDTLTTIVGVVTYLIVLVGNVLYFAIMESSSKQGTLGKLALGLVVTDANGQKISFLRGLGRYFAKILSGMILLIGYIMVAFTERKQGLHDIICSTLVVKGNPGEVGVDTSVFE